MSISLTEPAEASIFIVVKVVVVVICFFGGKGFGTRGFLRFLKLSYILLGGKIYVGGFDWMIENTVLSGEGGGKFEC